MTANTARGDALKAAREAKPWTQAQLAAAALVSPRTVIRAEAGGDATAETLMALCGALGINADALPSKPQASVEAPVTEDKRPVEEPLAVAAAGRSGGSITPRRILVAAGLACIFVGSWHLARTEARTVAGGDRQPIQTQVGVSSSPGVAVSGPRVVEITGPAFDGSCTGLALTRSSGDAPGDKIDARVMKQWVQVTVSDLFDYSFAKDAAIERPCGFMPKAWDRFASKMDVDGFRRAAYQTRSSGSAVLDRPPIIMGRGIDDSGSYSWIVEVSVARWLETGDDRTSTPPRVARLKVSQLRDDRGGTSLMVSDIY